MEFQVRKIVSFFFFFFYLLPYIFHLIDQVAIDPRIINKVLSIAQNNSLKLDQLSRHCAKLEYLFDEQRLQFGKFLKKFDDTDELGIKKGKSKKPSKNTVDICFQVCILFILIVCRLLISLCIYCYIICHIIRRMRLES